MLRGFRRDGRRQESPGNTDPPLELLWLGVEERLHLGAKHVDDAIPELVEEVVPARIDEGEGVVPDVRIAVQGLRIRWVLDEGIGLRKAAEGGIVVPSVVEIEAGRLIEPLAGELLGDARRSLVTAQTPEGRVLVEFYDGAGRVGDEVRAAEVIRMVEVERGRAGGFGRGDSDIKEHGLKNYRAASLL